MFIILSIVKEVTAGSVVLSSHLKCDDDMTSRTHASTEGGKRV